MLKFSFLILAAIFLPLSAFSAGSVVINEIAWMGTAASASDEWVELYNTTSGSIDLSGWTLSFFKPASTTASKIIQLTGTIPAGAYYLIERTDDNTVSDIVAGLVTAFGTGLVDTGMILKLDNNGATIDSSPELCDNKWCAGANNPEATMERINPLADGVPASNWATNNGSKINGKDAAGNNIMGTPKSENSVFAVSSGMNLPPPSSNQESPATPETSEPSNPPSSSSAPPETFKVYAGEDKTVLAGQEAVFSGKATDLKGNTIQNTNYLWNFGDGSTDRQRVSSHTFSFPGKYIVGLNASIAEESHGDYLNVEVLAPKIIISEARPGTDGFIELLNETGQKLDIGSLVIKDGLGGAFSIPKSTILAQNALLVFPNAVTQIFAKLSDLTLVTSNGKTIDKAHFEGVAGPDASFAREADKFLISLNPSPGAANPKVALAVSSAGVIARSSGDEAISEKGDKVTNVIVKTEPKKEKMVAQKSAESAKIAEKPKEMEVLPSQVPPAPPAVLAEQIFPIPTEKIAVAAEAKEGFGFAVNSKILLVASILVGILGATGFFILRSIGHF